MASVSQVNREKGIGGSAAVASVAGSLWSFCGESSPACPRRLTCLHEQRRTLCVLTKLRALSEEGLALSPSPCLAVHAGAAPALQRQPGEAGSLSSRAGGEVEAQRPAASAVGSRWFIELYLNVQH